MDGVEIGVCDCDDDCVGDAVSTKPTLNGSLQHCQAYKNVTTSQEGPQVLITRSHDIIHGQIAPLNFDQSLRKGNGLLSRKNALGSCSSTLYTFSDS